MVDARRWRVGVAAIGAACVRAGARASCARPMPSSSASAAGCTSARVDLALDPASLEDGDAVGDVEHEVEVLLDDQRWRGLLACASATGSRRSPRRSKAGCLRTARRAAASTARQSGAGEREDLLLAARQRAALAIEQRREARKSFRRSRSIASSWSRRRRRSRRGADCRARTGRAKCRGPAAHSRARGGCAREPARGDVGAVEADRAAGRRQQARSAVLSNVDLPMPLWPRMPTASPSFSCKRHAMQHRHVAIAAAQAVRRRGRRRCADASRRRVGVSCGADRDLGASSRAAPDVDLAHLRVGQHVVHRRLRSRRALVKHRHVARRAADELHVVSTMISEASGSSRG